jgi:magnesium/cobalt transport protein CorA
VSIRARLYDADRKDREVDIADVDVKGLRERQLLWIDVSGRDEAELRRLGELLDLHPQSRQDLLKQIGRPRLEIFGSYFALNLVALEPDDGEAQEVDVFAGRNWVATSHPADATFLKQFDKRVADDTELGQLDAPSFLASLLEVHVSGYFRIVEELEEQVDKLDSAALRASDTDRLLARLVKLRRRISRVRRSLAPHRELFAALASPDFDALAKSDSAAHFRALEDRLQRAIEAVENSRELLIGSFDIFMTRTAQRTNEVMKLMTLASVVLLPAIVIAGVMGMNFKLGFFDQPGLFYVVIGFMVALAVATIVFARARRWI